MPGKDDNFGHSTQSTARVSTLLNRWAGNGAIRAKYTTVTPGWFKYRAAAFALVKPLACICRHGFGFFVPASWTGNH